MPAEVKEVARPPSTLHPPPSALHPPPFALHPLPSTLHLPPHDLSCYQIILVKTSKILSSPEFFDLPQEAILIILQQETLTCEEIEIFKSCLNWSTKNLTSSVLENMAPLVSYIRFPVMSIPELSHMVRFDVDIFFAFFLCYYFSYHFPFPPFAPSWFFFHDPALKAVRGCKWGIAPSRYYANYTLYRIWGNWTNKVQ
jgi:hypothetical protein